MSWVSSERHELKLLPFPFHADEEVQWATLEALVKILEVVTARLGYFREHLEVQHAVEIILYAYEEKSKEKINPNSALGKAIIRVLGWLQPLAYSISKELVEAYNHAATGGKGGPREDALSLGLRHSASFGLDAMHDRMRAIYRLSYVDKHGRGVFERRN